MVFFLSLICTDIDIDFPVMPVEMMTISLKPSNFFTSNPSNDVPRSNDSFNKSALEHSKPVEHCPGKGC